MHANVWFTINKLFEFVWIWKTNTDNKKSVFLYCETNEDGLNIDFYSNFFKTNLFIGFSSNTIWALIVTVQTTFRLE